MLDMAGRERVARFVHYLHGLFALLRRLQVLSRKARTFGPGAQSECLPPEKSMLRAHEPFLQTNPASAKKLCHFILRA